MVVGCAGRQAQQEVDPKDQKIETLTSALSRAQSRIEELDAKMASLSDKVDATKIAVDNVTGNKPLSTESVGSIRVADPMQQGEHAAAAPVAAHSVTKADVEATSTDNVSVEFSKAMALYKAAKFSESELAFNHFTEQYPEHVLAGSAQFFAGESYFMMGEYNLATNEYSKVITTFANSPRASSAMVRLAQCYEASGAPKEAAQTLAMAKDLYPGNPSLDLPAPTVKAKKQAEAPAAAAAAAPATTHVAGSLQAAPMEPPSETKLMDQKLDDQKLDEKIGE